MKLLTLNAHSHLEGDLNRQTGLLAELILEERPSLIALQESSQPAAAAEADASLREGLFPVPGIGVPLRQDNHAALLAALLRRAGLPCAWTWLPVKLGWKRLDEGLAFLVPNGRIAETDAFPLTRSADYRSWKTRRALGIRPKGSAEWFYCVHMGWWDDPDEPFADQWRTLNSRLSIRRRRAAVWLMGDFNSPAEIRREGYDLIRSDGWHDMRHPARIVSGSATVHPGADGWHGRSLPPEGLRIDHIFRSRPCPALRWATVLDGQRGPQISDHAGVLLETESDNQEE